MVVSTTTSGMMLAFAGWGRMKPSADETYNSKVVHCRAGCLDGWNAEISSRILVQSTGEVPYIVDYSKFGWNSDQGLWRWWHPSFLHDR